MQLENQQQKNKQSEQSNSLIQQEQEFKALSTNNNALDVYHATHEFHLANVFNNFMAIWGKNWCSHLLDSETSHLAALYWARGLSDLTDDEIKAAIKKLSVKCEFAPTLAQFRKAALGIVTPAQAYARWRAGDHEGLIGLAASFKSWEMENWTENAIKERFLANYACIVDECLEVE